MAEEAKEVKPFSLDKTIRSTAPPDARREEEPDTARPVVPVMFTKPGEDYYTSDEPSAAPIFSDFRAAILPADSDVPVPGEDVFTPDDPELIEEEVEEEDEVAGDPKDLSAPASATSSPPSPTEPPVPTVQPDELNNPLTAALASLDAVKDNGQPKESESSTPTSSSTPTPNDGSSTPPA